MLSEREMGLKKLVAESAQILCNIISNEDSDIDKDIVGKAITYHDSNFRVEMGITLNNDDPMLVKGMQDLRPGDTIGMFSHGKLVRSFVVCEIEDCYEDDSVNANLYEINDDMDPKDKIQWWRILDIKNITWEVLSRSQNAA